MEGLGEAKKMKTIAIQGVKGAFHEIAARQYFEGEEINVLECYTFKDLFDAIAKDPELIGIVAIENTIAGSLLPNYALLRESSCSIVGEHKLRIEHNLAALPGQNKNEICEVYSQPIALMQCEDFFASHKYMRAIACEDTALSAKEIAVKGLKGRAAICSSLAAQMYELDILAKGIETNKRNFTRFLIIAQPQLASQLKQGKQVDKVSLVLSLSHHEGSLAKVLTILADNHMNLTKIQSLPIIGEEWRYQFYIDFTFTDYNQFQNAIKEIGPLTRDLEILGEYHMALTPE